MFNIVGNFLRHWIPHTIFFHCVYVYTPSPFLMLISLVSFLLSCNFKTKQHYLAHRKSLLDSELQWNVNIFTQLLKCHTLEACNITSFRNSISFDQNKTWLFIYIIQIILDIQLQYKFYLFKNTRVRYYCGLKLLFVGHTVMQ